MRLITSSLLIGTLFASQAHATHASYYADKFNGRKTATGETFTNQGMTCASNQYPLGTYVQVTNAKNGKSIVCKVNDRIGKAGRIDLTKKGFSQLAPLSQGLVDVDVKKVEKDKTIHLAQNDN
ncbi:septal ring lytic transglycosylase RlpA family protein [Moraxella sp. VT-16-12]|uniref:septal ring lytic transglycosylase RlpA family protein n=1 Tax=Moraxella sp. VT-16-12 TaxID=2014877 RepID=UPI000B7EDD18|nr:septal ring lytic transglycosylase RlpA family protein [Moraxella sp. VT-16-12]TWV81990.1 septal ring lytic transglycosylase RlpA family lipoprotein [Moraxella sp. VT-16-12]